MAYHNLNSIPSSYFMSKLWKKESTDDGDIHVDFLPKLPSKLWDEIYERNHSYTEHHFFGKALKPTKSDRVSTDFRLMGNKQFQQKRWREAMEHYNQSLRFAEVGSENVSLAYANRSTCFLHMKRYTQCLNDIALAKENNYPKPLMHKLDDRESRCLEEMKKSCNIEVEEDNETKLSFDPDEIFPCLANVLEIKTDKTFGRHIVAKCDIDVGQTVLVEEAFVSCFDSSDRIFCFNCVTALKNFIPCHYCTDAMFCDEICMQNDEIHKIACGASYNRLPGIKLITETILIALNAFETVDDLMEFVERELAAPRSDLPKNCSDAQFKYGMFLKLIASPRETNADQVCKQYITYRFIMDLPLCGARFNSIKKQRFLMHLIWQHKLISNNVFLYGMSNNNVDNMQILGNIQSLFNHSCMPNMFYYVHQNKLFGITMRPVKKGAQLYICYSENLWHTSIDERQHFLKRAFQFTCKCSRCVARSRPGNSSMMQADPVFQSIRQLKYSFRRSNVDGRSDMKQLCFEFLQKYGHLPSSDEIVFVMLNLIECLRKYPD